MSAKAEVYVDSIRNLIAVAWPTRSGYTIYDDDGRQQNVYVLPAGMTRLQEPPPASAPATPTAPATGPLRVLAFGT